MMRQNFYKEFAFIYDKLMTDVDYERWTEFILNNIPENSKMILETACGTGAITYNLAQRNFNITAFDISEEMLVNAYAKLRRYKNVRLLNQDMVKFKINLLFDVCLCCCDGINYLDRESVKIFFKRVFSHLNKNGKFIFDISTEYKYNSMDNTYVYDENDVFYVWENNIDRDNSTVSMEINFFVKSFEAAMDNESLSNETDKLIEDNNRYRRITEIQMHYIHKVSFIEEVLNDIGFTNIKIYDSYTNDSYRNQSLRATFVCEKGGD